MEKSFKKKIIIIVGLNAALAIFLSIILILTAFNINKRINQIENLQKELTFRTNALKSLATLKQDSEKANPYFNMLKQILPIKDDLIKFPKDLSEIAKRNKVDLGFAFGKETLATDQEPGWINFNFTLTSTYEDFLNFLKSIEASRYFIELESLDLTREPQTPKFAALISGKVFSQ